MSIVPFCGCYTRVPQHLLGIMHFGTALSKLDRVMTTQVLNLQVG